MPIPSVKTSNTNNLSLETFPDLVRPISATYSRTTTTVTVTSTAHGLPSGREIKVVSATDAGLVNGNFPIKWVTITSTGANTFTFATASTGTATGSLTYIGKNLDADQIDSDPSLPA
jgi:hypothetical protein